MCKFDFTIKYINNGFKSIIFFYIPVSCFIRYFDYFKFCTITICFFPKCFNCIDKV